MFGGHHSPRASIKAAVRRLPTRQREVVTLRYFLDLGEDEIAQTLGINVGTVKSQLAKARQIKQGMMQELLTGRTRLR